MVRTVTPSSNISSQGSKLMGSALVLMGITFAAILITGIKFTWNLENLVDLTFADEGYYLFQGMNLHDRKIPGPTFGVAYSVWYFLLSFIQPDRVELHYFNHRIITILLPLVFFVTALRYRVPIFVATLAAFWLLIADVNLNVIPKINHFALITLLVAFAIMANWSRLAKLNLLTFTTFGISFMRPEMLYVSILLLGITVIDNVRTRRPLRDYVITAGIALFMGLITVVYGAATEGDRSFIAVSQHFALNWVEWTNSELFPWSNYESIWQENFGDAESIGGALRNNPEAFIRHMLINAQRFPGVAASLFFNHPSLVLLQEQFALEGIIVAILLVVGLVATYKWWVPFVAERWRTHTFLLIFASFLVLMTLAQIVIIYPREHYFPLLNTILLLILVLTISGRPTTQTPTRWEAGATIAVALLFLILIPSTFTYRGLYQGNHNYLTVQLLKSLPLAPSAETGRIEILDPDNGYYFYLDNRYQPVFPQAKNSNGDFYAFLERQDFSVLVVSPLLKRDSRYVNDTEWLYFLDHPEEFGFFAMPVPDTFRVLYVAESHYTPP
jgi:hypothetical protein